MKPTALAHATETEPVFSAAAMRIVIVGHVDHGKSTLVGRLLYETGALEDGKFAAIEASCKKRGMPFEWSFLLDALQAERDQAITIDTTQIWFSSSKRRYNLIDAPGHREFLKNMITGAASADAAVLVIDASEGVKEQSRRHGYLLHLLGIRQIIVAVNKMDLVNYSETRFRAIAEEYEAYLKQLGVVAANVVPVSGRQGDLLIQASDHMPWYDGPSLLGALDDFMQLPSCEEQALRLCVQDVYKFDERRIIVGRVESGVLREGDELLFLPSRLKASVNRLTCWPEAQHRTEAFAGESVGFTLKEQIFVERGHVAAPIDRAPYVTDHIQGRIFWLGDEPLKPGNRYRMKLATGSWMAEVKHILKVLDTDDLSTTELQEVGKHQVAEVVLRLRGLVPVDDHAAFPHTGRFVLVDDYKIAGGGIVSFEGTPQQMRTAGVVKSQHITAVDYAITPVERAKANGHRGGVLWFTGLSGSGKSTLAKELQLRLFERGYQVYVLDGDNVRHGLCADLGFSPEDRQENIRRVGEVASLFADAGMIVITAFISPYKEDRRRARAAAKDYFNVVHIEADVATCEARDVKGLYKKARSGEIKDFTGVSAPYEPPEQADLKINTMKNDIEACVAQLLDYVEVQFGRIA